MSDLGKILKEIIPPIIHICYGFFNFPIWPPLNMLFFSFLASQCNITLLCNMSDGINEGMLYFV